ncbi:MAG: class I SAM-dependent methyltransferase [Parvularculaceae bacterium]|nr:MAG: class I SAM-dependent methyltransferase [Parvularculaceae bacterium]
MSNNLRKSYGGSPEAIEHHYDVGTDFYSTWLDSRLVYSCAMWDGLSSAATLEQAQYRKLEFHANQAGAASDAKLLDIGCGWGAMLRHLVVERGVELADGITLSPDQHKYIQVSKPPRVRSSLKSWTDYSPDTVYDGIISIGAFEHFADPSQTQKQRVEVYRLFMRKCADWLTKRGKLSLQTIAYGNMSAEQANSFMQREIFPNAELPTLQEIVAAADGSLEVIRVRNDALDYAKTCEEWARRLRKAYRDDRSICSEEQYERYIKYLKMSAIGFRMGKLQLLRFKFAKPGWREA